jgi:cytochrome c
MNEDILRSRFFLLVLLATAILVLLSGCGRSKVDTALIQSIGGNPERGRAALYNNGCGACHTISGVTGANGRVGPPLSNIGNRWYIAGLLPNTPANMIRWIRNPQDINPKTAMPNLDVSEAEARDMVTYLYTSAK